MNACPMDDTMEVGNPGDDIETTLAAVKALNTKVSFESYQLFLVLWYTKNSVLIF